MIALSSPRTYVFSAVAALVAVMLAAGPVTAQSANGAAFIEACADAETATALQCACIEEEIARQYSGVERAFLEGFFTGGMIISEDEASALSDDDQQALSDSAGKIGRECGVTPEHKPKKERHR